MRRKQEMEREQREAMISRRQQFDALLTKDSAFGNDFLQYQKANKTLWVCDFCSTQANLGFVGFVGFSPNASLVPQDTGRVKNEAG